MNSALKLLTIRLSSSLQEREFAIEGPQLFTFKFYHNCNISSIEKAVTVIKRSKKKVSQGKIVAFCQWNLRFKFKCVKCILL
ncbi:hypothetical protein T01_9763 [Trichinella spiralis]|uniref:Uncharacterized protein n=1 Tax=Trichinella spiralis TaxID=6334 RepID=A0A0V1BRH1_TRISP|nr:hypothetical protein T01_9763 [Trichinella spiralis]